MTIISITTRLKIFRIKIYINIYKHILGIVVKLLNFDNYTIIIQIVEQFVKI